MNKLQKVLKEAHTSGFLNLDLDIEKYCSYSQYIRCEIEKVYRCGKLNEEYDYSQFDVPSDAEVVTRHKALLDYLLEMEYISEKAQIYTGNVSPRIIENKKVIGILPFNMAALTESITLIPLHSSFEERGEELCIERLREIADLPQTYFVRKVGDIESGEK